ncbi:MAG TPA: hypothetical protein VLA88_05755 [Candidatus Saccharimonadales bacterium]|nr:hypothetical protein [Candidatus Saccharimonadales bacterium]
MPPHPAFASAAGSGTSPAGHWDWRVTAGGRPRPHRSGSGPSIVRRVTVERPLTHGLTVNDGEEEIDDRLTQCPELVVVAMEPLLDPDADGLAIVASHDAVLTDVSVDAMRRQRCAQHHLQDDASDTAVAVAGDDVVNSWQSDPCGVRFPATLHIAV